MQSKRSKRRVGSLKVKKLVAASVCGLCVWFGSVSVSHADIITLVPADTVDDLLDGTVSPIGSVRISPSDVERLDVVIYSQAYMNETHTQYAYLYQVDNKITSTDPVEMFTLSPFYGADETVQMGYLTGDEPLGFLDAPYKDPQPKGWVNPSGPIISFYYTWLAGDPIQPGERSPVMYVLSDLSPDLIWGNVINGLTATEEVVGPVPEPGTITLISVGGLAILLRRRRRQGA